VSDTSQSELNLLDTAERGLTDSTEPRARRVSGITFVRDALHRGRRIRENESETASNRAGSEALLIRRAIVLLSGGVDSATALYWAKERFDEVYAMTMTYTETYDHEIEAAKQLAAAAHVKEHFLVHLPFVTAVESKYHPTPSDKISPIYFPARNIIFYGIAAAHAEARHIGYIVFGSNADDSTELPDARPAFIRLMNRIIKAGTRTGMEGGSITIVNPLIKRSKPEVIKLAFRLHVPLQLTWSCCDETAKMPCGKCVGCEERIKSFKMCKAADPSLNVLLKA